MPQMSPLNWLTLFVLFTTIFIMFCMLNYFSFLPSSPKTQTPSKISNIPMNWKW